jgi:molybdopterin-guanine dinucleotide biosynthesis protein A
MTRPSCDPRWKSSVRHSPLPLTGCVLAGGASVRFGSAKALAPWADGTVIEAVIGQVSSACRSTIVVGRRLRELRFVEERGVRLVRDRFRTHHPLGGLLTGLEAATSPWVFVAACDTPLLQAALVRALWRMRSGALAVVARSSERLQPFSALYHQDSIPIIRAAIRARNLSLQSVLATLDTRVLPPAMLARSDPEELSFRDADTRSSLQRLRALVRAGDELRSRVTP